MKRFLIPVAALCLLASCGGTNENPDARRLFDDADAAFRSGDYTESTILLDSLQKGFPEEIAIQREALALRPKVIEQLALLKIASVDSMTQVDK